MKNSTESGSAQFRSVRFPELDDRAHVDTDDMKKSLLSLFETLQYGNFENIYEAWCCIRGEPVLPPNFNRDDLKQRTGFVSVRIQSISTCLASTTKCV